MVDWTREETKRGVVQAFLQCGGWAIGTVAAPESTVALRYTYLRSSDD